ncbi:hypothetical protein H4W23_40530 [Streptomyces gardneri]|uniref:hypothetical protein n=1 Tax=Streptomyces gardneri TaxID=66892 RepID=UPI0018C3FB46|nr:hypothetical protein [Streptomyces gardneri]QPK43219.1 hypothetical protein H4W23_00090 [Streptomyces gardneri]QPK50242.1 hypothetical protein H4W23_40530 [Streptomyces gardneri]WRK34430.1 hypothetical protein U0M97_00085 [Streptomyces venezuelae]
MRSTPWPGSSPPAPRGVRSLRSGLRPYQARGVRVAAELDERARVFLDHHPAEHLPADITAT